MEKKSLGDVLKQDFSFSSFGTLSRIVAGIFPKRADIRVKFGLSPMVSVAVCPNCGKVHTRTCRRKCQVGWVLEVAGVLKQMEEKANE